MTRICVFVAFVITISCFRGYSQGPSPSVLRNMESDIFKTLNSIRNSPKDFVGAYNLKALLRVKPRPALIWDEDLAKFARAKAEDMANRNYFDHVNPDGKAMNIILSEGNYPLPTYFPVTKKDNSIESIVAYSDGPQMFLELLIVDAGIPNVGHRKHLLGMDEFNSKHTHAAIGIAYNPNSTYKYYGCILITHKKEQ